MINEHKYNAAVTHEKLIRYYQGLSSKVPYAIVFAVDGTLKSASRYVYVAINIRKMKRDINNYNKELFLELKNTINGGTLEDFSEISFYDYFTVMKKTKSELMTYMVQEQTMPYSSFVDEFGEVENTNTPKYKNASLIFPIKMRQSRKDNLMDILAATDAVLSRKNVGYLIEDGIIQFDNIGNGTEGEYHYDTATPILKIDPKTLKNETTIHTIIHELGHKLWYEYMTNQQHTEVDEVFDMHVKNAKAVFSKEDIKKLATIGASYEYIGKLAKRKKFNPYEVTKYDGKDITLVSTPFDGLIMTITAEPHSLVGGWKINGKQISMRTVNTDSWAVTHYAKTNSHEFFSETFAHYCLGFLHGEPLAWIQGFMVPLTK